MNEKKIGLLKFLIKKKLFLSFLTGNVSRRVDREEMNCDEL